MARNLILLSTLDHERYKYRGGNKVLKVSKGSLAYMIGDMNSVKLYVLRGSTLPGIAAAINFDEPSRTNLWHARLRHMREHGMAELIKRELLDCCNISWSFVNAASFVSTKELNSMLPFIPLKEY
jgi:hypothetical protein